MRLIDANALKATIENTNSTRRTKNTSRAENAC